MFTPWKLFNKANSHLRPRQYGPPYNHNPSSSKLPAASFSNLPIRPLPHKFKGGWVGIILLLQWVATLSTSWKWLIPTTVISHFYNTKHCLFQIPPPSLLSGLRGKPCIIYFEWNFSPISVKIWHLSDINLVNYFPIWICEKVCIYYLLISET